MSGRQEPIPPMIPPPAPGGGGISAARLPHPVTGQDCVRFVAVDAEGRAVEAWVTTDEAVRFGQRLVLADIQGVA